MSDHPEWSVRCPWCNAPPGQRCTSAGRGRRLQIASHDARITAWTAAQATDDQRTGEPE